MSLLLNHHLITPYIAQLLHPLLLILINTMSKSTGSAILLFLACIAIAIFYIIAIVSSYDDDGSVVGQRQQDAFSSSNNLRQLSLIDPKTVETRQGSSIRSSGVSFNDQHDREMSKKITIVLLRFSSEIWLR